MNLLGDTPQIFRTATSDLYCRIREAILKGQFRPGERLVRRVIAKRYEVSHIPVTEVLMKLERDGLVESAPMYGSRVKAITPELIIQEQELREAIECHCARLCAERMTGEKLARLKKMAPSVDRLMGGGDSSSWEGMTRHLEFHLEIARQTEVPLLEQELRRVGFLDLMRATWINSTAFMKMPYDWHQSLVKVLAGGKPNAAEIAMRKHVRYGLKHLHEAALQMAEKESKGETLRQSHRRLARL